MKERRSKWHGAYFGLLIVTDCVGQKALLAHSYPFLLPLLLEIYFNTIS
jgi:hypothetical protein